MVFSHIKIITIFSYNDHDHTNLVLSCST